MFERFLSFKGEAYFESFQELVSADRGEYFDGDFDFADCMQDWMQSRALKNRGIYATRLIYCILVLWVTKPLNDDILATSFRQATEVSTQFVQGKKQVLVWLQCCTERPPL